MHDTLTLFARTSSGGSWQLLQAVPAVYESWIILRVPLSSFVGTQGQVQFAFEYKYGNGKGIGLDRIWVGEELVCTMPTNMQAFRFTDTQAEIMWAAHETAVSFDIKVSTSPLTDLSGTANVLDSVIMDRPFVLTGLNPNTTYYCYLKADCGYDDISSWSEALSFKTLCSPVNIPYTENFDDYGVGAGSLPSCWNDMTTFLGDWLGVTSLSSYYPKCYSQIRYNGAASLCLSSYYNYAVSYSEPRITYQLVSLPKMNVADISDYPVSFMAYSVRNNYQLSVGLMTDASAISNFEEIVFIYVFAANTL